ncbi:MAG: Sec-independent protein translocase protein TatB [Pseudomonadota bacterium]
MFDIGFTELLVIGVVALLVVGPERLPRVARTAGHLFGRFQRYVSTVKADIGREMELDELRKAGLSFKQSVEDAARGVETGIQEAEYSMRDEVVNPIEEAAKSVAQPDLFDDPAKREAERQAAAASAGELADKPGSAPEASP